MKSKIKYIFILLILIFPIDSKSETIIISQPKHGFEIGKYVKYFEDKNNLPFQDILKKFNQNEFNNSNDTNLNFGFTESTYWLAFDIKNEQDTKEPIILQLDWSHYNYIKFISIIGDKYNFIETGDLLPFNKRQINHRTFCFLIPFKNKDLTRIFIKIKSNDSIQIPISIWSKSLFDKNTNIENILFGIFFGILIVMIFYNLFLLISINDINYFFYISYILLQLIFQVSFLGYGYQYIWPEYPIINNLMLPLSTAIVIITPILFAKYFLNIKEYSNRINIIYWLMVIILLIDIILLFIGHVIASFIISNTVVIFAIFLLIFSSIYVLKKGYNPAKYFLIAWIILLFTTILFALKNSGILTPNIITSNSVYFGISIEVILLSFALSDRYNTFRKEKFEAQSKLLEVQKTYSESLEKTVHERTKELQDRNKTMEHDIALARKIQDKLIPDATPVKNISSIYKPMEEVGGDFYDFIEFRDSNNIGIFLSDVSGHGVPAAFITSMIKTIILQSRDRIHDPAQFLLYMNEVLQSQTAGNFVTAFYCIYNPDENSIYYSNAGHNQPYIISQDNVTQLQKGKNTAIAMFSNKMLEQANKKFINHKDILEPGSKLLLYTDGLVEARPTDSDIFFEYANMEQVFIDNHKYSCDIFLHNLMKELSVFRKSDQFDDDICLICLDV